MKNILFSPIKKNVYVKKNSTIKKNVSIKKNSPIKKNLSIKKNSPIKKNLSTKKNSPKKMSSPKNANNEKIEKLSNQINDLQKDYNEHDKEISNILKQMDPYIQNGNKTDKFYSLEQERKHYTSLRDDVGDQIKELKKQLIFL